MPPGRRSAVRDELDEHAVGGAGVEEADLVSARTGPRRLVDERDARPVELAERPGQVVDGERDVVEAGLAARALEEFLQAWVTPARRDQLHAGAGLLGREEERCLG